MESITPVEEKRSLLHNDRLLVCGMFIFYGLCFLGLIGAAIWGIGRANNQIAVDATSTAQALSTQKAQAISTAVARSTQQAKYEIIDPFDDNGRQWLVESIDDEYLTGKISVSTGLYVWNIHKVKQPFVYWANVFLNRDVRDFDVYVDSKFVQATHGNACTGLVFRTVSWDWEDGAYIFSVCNDAYFDVDYYKDGDWESLSERIYSTSFKEDDWNRLEVSARGDEFTFRINNELVYELTDDRIKEGGLALLVEMEGEDPATIWFDNFGLQRH